MPLPATLPELLQARASDTLGSAKILFLDSKGNLSKILSYADLFNDASALALRLIGIGLTQNDIVLASFPDHDSHIRLFWACCLAGIPICPLPAFHHDHAKKTKIFKHLRELFHEPTLVTTTDGVRDTHVLASEIRAITLHDLPTECPGAASKIFPAQPPSPDDTVCLMLKPESAGIPKAVPLSHSNLLSTIRGKVLHHNSTSHSRFLNWIAFDHVASVSEIHLHALEANASQWHLPPMFIISDPCNLLRWVSTFKITYTFSPTFLLARIVREARITPLLQQVDLSHLQALISWGDTVPGSAAIAIADLIESLGGRCNALKASFGMSETGGGCIYDTSDIDKVDRDAPPVLGYTSAGMCCDGVHVRIVDVKTGTECPLLNTGRLQISGPAVFTSYYGDQQAARESFTGDGWFITGRLAQLNGDRNISFVQEDENSINIDYIKYPVHDVEHHIEDSRIDGLIHSTIYVCPMRRADEKTETYAVFYEHEVVSDVELDMAKKCTLQKINQEIRSVCTAFVSQAPFVVLPLSRYALVELSLGKVSRSNLSTIYLEGAFRDIQDALETRDVVEDDGKFSDLLTTISDVVIMAVASVLSLNPITLQRSQNIFDLGISSLDILRLKHILQDRLSLAEIPTVEILRRPNIGSLCDYLAVLLDSGKTSVRGAYHPLVCLKSTGVKPPLFLVHPDIGEVLTFVRLARALADDRPVYVLRASGLELGERLSRSFEETVKTYLSAVQECWPSGPYYLAGYSFGGTIAFDIAQRLEQKGMAVAWVGIFNFPPCIQLHMNQLTWGEVLLNAGVSLSLIPASALDDVRNEFRAAFPEISARDEEPSNPYEPVEWVFAKSESARLIELDLRPEVFARWVSVAYGLNRVGRSFEQQGSVKRALMTVFRASPSSSTTKEVFERDRLLAWKDFGGDRFETVEVDGEHHTMLSQTHVNSFAKKMRSALRRAAVTSDRKTNFEEVPIIDFALSQSDPDAYFEQLRFALEDVGFGIFVNVPGFEASFQEELFSLAENLFNKPQEWKDSLGTDKSPSLRGYFRADKVSGSNKAYAEAYRFGLDMPSPGKLEDPSIPFWLKLHEGPNQWPPEDQLPLFREKMEILFQRYHILNLQLNSHICRLLSISDEILQNFFPEKTEFNCAIWHYFPVTSELLKEERNGFVQGMHEHRDPSTFVTGLIQSRQGLQVQNHLGAWIDIPMVEGGVVCNIGMQLMNLTGGKLVATTHRVNTLKIDKDRYTIPYVLSTKLDKPIIPLPAFASPESAKPHVAPNPKIAKLMAIKDPLMRSGFARLTLFPAATQVLYPAEFEEARRMGIV